MFGFMVFDTWLMIRCYGFFDKNQRAITRGFGYHGAGYGCGVSGSGVDPVATEANDELRLGIARVFTGYGPAPV